MEGWYQNQKPNNWRSLLAVALEYDELTGDYYLHSFFKEMPDLNWRNKDLKNTSLMK